MRTLKWPDALAQPTKEWSGFRKSPEQRLAQVNVRLDKTGNNDQARGIELCSTVNGCSRVQNRTYSPIGSDVQVSVPDGPVPVHRHHPGTSNDRPIRSGSSFGCDRVHDVLPAERYAICPLVADVVGRPCTGPRGLA